jgi:hypothetical protein
MREVFSIIVVLTFSLCAVAQMKTYKGRLISSLTGKPVKEALIDQKGSIVSSSDSLGYFSINLDSASNVELGFSSSDVGNMTIKGFDFKLNEILLISLPVECQYSYEDDFKNGSIKFLMVFNAFSKPLSASDFRFEKKYNVSYYGYGDGCTGIVLECIDTYNHKTAKYLDSKFGKGWRKKVNKFISGI